MSPTTRILRTTVLAVVLVATPTVVAAAPASAATGCSTVWGSLAKSRAPAGEQGLQFLLDVRSGQHTCYDRVVFDLTGNDSGPVGYHVEYVTAVTNEETGRIVPLDGGAQLRVVIGQGSFDHGSQSSAYRPADPTRLVNPAGYRTLRQVAWADTFDEADLTTTVGIGVRARLPMRAFLLPSPGQFFGQRLVIDVAHHW